MLNTAKTIYFEGKQKQKIILSAEIRAVTYGGRLYK
jgi:hypothetical protein